MRVALRPEQIVVSFTDTVGAATIVIVPESTADPQLAVLNVTVYVLVEVALIVMLCVVAPPGDQRYVPPGDDGVAVSTTCWFTQTAVSATLTDGRDTTVTVTESALEHPRDVTVTL